MRVKNVIASGIKFAAVALVALSSIVAPPQANAGNVWKGGKAGFGGGHHVHVGHHVPYGYGYGFRQPHHFVRPVVVIHRNAYNPYYYDHSTAVQHHFVTKQVQSPSEPLFRNSTGNGENSVKTYSWD